MTTDTQGEWRPIANDLFEWIIDGAVTSDGLLSTYSDISRHPTWPGCKGLLMIIAPTADLSEFTSAEAERLLKELLPIDQPEDQGSRRRFAIVSDSSLNWPMLRYWEEFILLDGNTEDKLFTNRAEAVEWLLSE